MKNIQLHLHSVRKRARKHKIALHHIKKAISQMEKVYEHTNYRYGNLTISTYEMRMYKIQEQYEYKHALLILKNHMLFTA